MKVFQRRFHSSAFTLVEIMIIVAIISMLSVIAMPNILRARKRAQATRILDDLRLIDGALDTYAIENSKGAGDVATWSDIQPFLKKDSPLYNCNGRDLLGNAFSAGQFSVDTMPKLNAKSFSTLSDVAPVEFWSPFAP
jgi:type II secretory pathway pseudopilin PulG